MKSRAAVLVLVWVFITLTGVILCQAYKAPKYTFSKYQPTSLIHDDYVKCKENAPPGFDCMMQPVMVSEQFIKDNAK